MMILHLQRFSRTEDVQLSHACVFHMQGATKWRTQVRTYGKSPNNRLALRPKVLKSTEANFIHVLLS